MSVPALSASWPALGMDVEVQVRDAPVLERARAVVAEELAAADRAYSPVRGDTELAEVLARGGERVAAGVHLREALTAARRAARLTGGLVDATSAIEVRPGPGRLRARRRPAWRRIDCERGALRVPDGVRIDLGAVGKALIADRCARRIGAGTTGVLVSVGGDLATAGKSPQGGWHVRVVDDHRQRTGGVLIRLPSGALATSSVSVRRSTRGAHIVDPRTGRPVEGPWSTVSVAAATCVDANTASTAAILLGHAAPAWLAERELPARLRAVDGSVVCVAGWPEQP